MNRYMLLVLGFCAGIAGCAREEPPAQVAADVAAEATPPADAASVELQTEGWRDSAFIDHMHAHAEHLDDINYALGDDDLEGALVPAYWMARHEMVQGVPDELQPFLVSMREAAQGVEAAADLDAARTAAAQIGTACQGCHAATGVITE